jgi:membrane protease subunit HflK
VVKRRPFRWRALLPWIAAVYVATGFYAVQPDEQAVVRRCGKLLAQVRTPGLHFGFPWPIDRVSRFKILQTKPVGIGMSLADRDLGRLAQPQQSESLTGDRNLIVAGAIVHYRIADPVDYLLNTADVNALVRDTSAGALASAVSAANVDDVLTVERVRIQDEVRQAAQDLLDSYRAGVRVTSVSLEGVAPPQEVAEAFRDVAAAKADQQRLIQEAEGYVNRLGPQTRGEANRIRMEAEAYADEAVKRAQGDGQRFTQMAAELASGRALTVKRLILETMEVVFPRLKKIVVDDRQGQAVDLGLIEENQ